MSPPPDGPRKGLSGFWLVGTTVVIYAASVLAGTSLIVGIFLPLLLTLIALQYNLRALAVILALFLVGVLIVHRTEIQLLTEFGVLVLGLGVLVPFGWGWVSFPTTLWLASVVQLAGLAMVAVGAWWLGGSSPGDWVVANFNQSAELFLARAREEALAPESQAALNQLIDSLRRMVRQTYPVLLFINLAVVNLINLQFLQPVLVTMQPGRALYLFPRGWRLPSRLHWLLLLCGVAFVTGGGAVQVGAINGVLLLAFLYLLQGFGLLAHFLGRVRVPVLLRTLLYGILILSFQVYPLLVVAGVAEGIFDLRHLRRPAAGDGG